MLLSSHKSLWKHEGMPKVSIPLNDVSLPLESMPIDINTIPITVPATVINSTSYKEGVASIPKIHLFPLLVEEFSAGVDVDAVKIKGGEYDANKDDDEYHIFNSINKDAFNNISSSFNYCELKSKEPSANKIKTSLLYSLHKAQQIQVYPI